MKIKGEAHSLEKNHVLNYHLKRFAKLRFINSIVRISNQELKKDRSSKEFSSITNQSVSRIAASFESTIKEGLFVGCRLLSFIYVGNVTQKVIT
mmetsp:Transcript_17398/g.36486  ORF Transcript_17398/g.36486 Transcript_17398/m.36486 type:complete len:94 (+) Transcript_17398:129-410(+)